MSDICDNCQEKAVWHYMPGDQMMCEEHVPRGCSCNHRYVSPDAYHPKLSKPDDPYVEGGIEGVDWKWIDEEKTHWSTIDEMGREFPCCEWNYDNKKYDNS